MSKNPANVDIETKEQPNDKQYAFCVHFVNNGFVGWRAAKSAGYAGNYNTLCVTASRLLRNDKVRAEIDLLLKEKLLGKDDLLVRLAEMIYVDAREFAGLTLEEIKKHPKGFLIKKIKHRKSKDGSEYWEVETYSSLDAIELLGRHMKLWASGAGESADNPIHLRIDDMTELFRMVQAHTEGQK